MSFNVHECDAVINDIPYIDIKKSYYIMLESENNMISDLQKFYDTTVDNARDAMNEFYDSRKKWFNNVLDYFSLTNNMAYLTIKYSNPPYNPQIHILPYDN